LKRILNKKILVGILLIGMLIIGMAFIYGNYRNSEVVLTNLNITNVNDAIPKVALTFDDGPSSVYTKILLDGLKERKVKATFFLVGENVENNKKLTKRISKEGHLIGNHTYSHADLARTNYNKASVEINKTNEIITSITGTSPKYIRPPYGDVNKKLLENTGMRVVLWNVDPEDWKDQNADIVVNRIISHVRPGDIILLHDIFKSSVEAALKTVDILQDKGYQFVTVDKLNNSTIK
jgi:peptidoglycan/xylan/chitin deacetylase (PgdA/CDA1 family)